MAFKEKMIRRLTGKDAVSASQLARETDAAASEIDGTTLDGASHIDAAAAPSEIMLSAPTYELFRQLDAEPAPPLLLPGGSAPVPVHRLVGAQDAFRRGRFSATTTPFVGRADELATLRRAWERASEGASHGVLIVGEGRLGRRRGWPRRSSRGASTCRGDAGRARAVAPRLGGGGDSATER